MKKIIPALFILWGLCAAAGAAEQVMTYQGRLKQNNIPANGLRSFEFNFADSYGTLTPSPSGAQDFEVKNGLFKSTFTVPAGLDLISNPMFLEVVVNGSALSPREPLTYVPYAVYAASASYAAGAVQKTGDSMGGLLDITIAAGSPGLSVSAAGGAAISLTPGAAEAGLTSNAADRNIWVGPAGIHVVTVSKDGLYFDNAARTISSETLAGLGAGLRVSTNVYIVGFSSAAAYYGNGANLTGITASGFSSLLSVDHGGTGLASAGGTPNRVLRTADGTVWAAGQVDLANDVTGTLGKGSVTGLTGDLTLIAADTTTIAGALAAEVTARGGADTALSGRLDTVASDTTTLQNVKAARADVVYSTGHAMTGSLVMAGASTITVAGSAFSVGGSIFKVDNGVVGVGTAQPDQKLTVAGNISQTGVLISSGSGTGVFNYMAGRLGIGTTGSATLDMLSIDSGGSNPQHVGISIRNSDAKKETQFQTGRGYGASEYSYIGTVTADPFALRTGGQNRLVIDAAGLTGLGTTTPEQAFTVAGNISQTGVLISSGTQNNYFAGRVGIGLTAPQAKLAVQQGGNEAYVLTVSSADSKDIISAAADGAVVVGSPVSKPSLTNTPRLMVHAFPDLDGDSSIADEVAQIWTDNDGVIVSSMMADGRLYADASVLRNIPVNGDNLGDHTATKDLALNGYSIGGVTTLTAKALALNGSLEALSVSSNVYIVGYSSAARYYGDGSQLKNVVSAGAVLRAGDVMTGPLQASSITVTGANFSVGGAALIVQGGKVGISTGAPQAALDLVAAGSTMNESAQIWRNSVGTVVASMTATGFVHANGGAIGGQLDVSSAFYVKGSGSQFYSLVVSTSQDHYGLVVTTAGRVGIGTASSPAYALQISAPSGTSDQMLVISTGASTIFGVKGNGEVYTSGKYIGDGSGLSNLSGDDLGDHTATKDLVMNDFAITGVSSITTGGSVSIGPAHSGNEAYGVSIGSGSYNNYSYGVGVGYKTNNNYGGGVGIGENASTNYSYGVGIGNDSVSNYSMGVGLGNNASNNNTGGVGIGSGAGSNGTYGVGIGYNASGNTNYAVGLGAYSKDNGRYSAAVGAYSYAASSSAAFGSYAKANAAESLAFGAGTVNNSSGTAAFGSYAVVTSSRVSAARYEVAGVPVLAMLRGEGSMGIGLEAGLRNTGNYNLFIGSAAGAANTTASGNTYVGYWAGINSVGTSNTFVGASAGKNNTTGTNNTIVGGNAALNIYTGKNNTYMGYQAAHGNSAGSGNAVFGANAGLGSGAAFSSSTIMGYQAGNALTSGSDNVLLGFQAGNSLTTGTGNVIIGYDQDASVPEANGELNIGGLLFGNTAANTIGISTRNAAAMFQVGGGTLTVLAGGKVGIGTKDPVAALHVNGTVKLRQLTAEPDTSTTRTMGGDDFGKVLISSNTFTQTLTLPMGMASDIGGTVTIVKLGKGKVIIDAQSTDYIAGSSLGGTLSNDAVSPPDASVTLMLVSANYWAIISGQGAWIAN